MNKTFKILVAALAMTSTQSFAGMMAQTRMSTPEEYFNGFYLGLGGGIVKPNAEVEYDYAADVVNQAGAPIAEISKNFRNSRAD